MGIGKQMAETDRLTSNLHIGVVYQTTKEEVSTNLTDYSRKSTAQSLMGT